MSKVEFTRTLPWREIALLRILFATRKPCKQDLQGFYHLFPPIIANASFQSSGNLYSISPSRSSISNQPVHINAQIIYTRALRIIFPEKPVNPALIRLTVCNQTGCECIVGASNPSLMKGLRFYGPRVSRIFVQASAAENVKKRCILYRPMG